ncbi:MAG: Rieske 2Fe-2S domain-containing protein, partial [Myxococcales bacterium]|nr:Rieske 2Fe-2S domain-containing protein [Myxococcales bacterium]
RVRYIGHAGFEVRSQQGTTLLVDPWLSPHGAFLHSWFQFPQNHHLAEEVAELEAQDGLLYLSHHHRDHFDRDFLARLDKDTPLVVPRFVRRHFVKELKQLGFRDITELLFGETVSKRGFRLTLFVDDSYSNEDSGVLIEADGTRFLNMNDCRAYDRIDADSLQPLDLFTIQFSGASWFPSVYDYPKELRDQHAAAKNQRKFANIRKLIERLEPKLYVPSAGPACFLDEPLQGFNFGDPSPFPDALDFFEQLRAIDQRSEHIFAGDVIALQSDHEPVVERAGDFDESIYTDKEKYVAAYAAIMRANAAYGTPEHDAWDDLVSALRAKLAALRKPLETTHRLAFSLIERPDKPPAHLVIDFQASELHEVDNIPHENVYHYTVENAVMRKFLDDRELWEDFHLSLRFAIHRNPDVFDVAISDFVRLEASNLGRYPFKQRTDERIRAHIDGKLYEFDRYCPHQGGDLQQASFEDGAVICPRHAWKFCLNKGGACTDNATTINASVVDDAD